jgi:hypothetical protein
MSRQRSMARSEPGWGDGRPRRLPSNLQYGVGEQDIWWRIEAGDRTEVGYGNLVGTRAQDPAGDGEGHGRPGGVGPVSYSVPVHEWAQVGVDGSPLTSTEIGFSAAHSSSKPVMLRVAGLPGVASRVKARVARGNSLKRRRLPPRSTVRLAVPSVIASNPILRCETHADIGSRSERRGNRGSVGIGVAVGKASGRYRRRCWQR